MEFQTAWGMLSGWCSRLFRCSAVHNFLQRVAHLSPYFIHSVHSLQHKNFCIPDAQSFCFLILQNCFPPSIIKCHWFTSVYFLLLNFPWFRFLTESRIPKFSEVWLHSKLICLTKICAGYEQQWLYYTVHK